MNKKILIGILIGIVIVGSFILINYWKSQKIKVCTDKSVYSDESIILTIKNDLDNLIFIVPINLLIEVHDEEWRPLTTIGVTGCGCFQNLKCDERGFTIPPQIKINPHSSYNLSLNPDCFFEKDKKYRIRVMPLVQTEKDKFKDIGFYYSNEFLVKEPQVIIETDKTEYEQGDTVIITIKNNLDKTIVFKTDCFPEYGRLGLWEIERKEKDGWKKVKMLLPLEGKCLPGYFGIAPCIEKMKPQSEFHQEWDQKICLFNGSDSLFLEKPILLQEGTYRLVFTYSDKFRKDEYTLTEIEIITPRKIYSNEFIIKERCAKAGELVNYPPGTNKYLPDVCCEGLKPLAGFEVNEKGECERVEGGPFLTCMPCGNGVCETINNFDENKCNCPEDCK